LERKTNKKCPIFYWRPKRRFAIREFQEKLDLDSRDYNLAIDFLREIERGYEQILHVCQNLFFDNCF
jgi:hypothetical protein